MADSLPVAAAASSFFTPTVIIGVVATLGIVALAVYFYRANQDLLNRLTEQQKTIEKQQQTIQFLHSNYIEMKKQIDEMRDAMVLGTKKRKALEKMMKQTTDDVYELTEQISYSEPSEDGKGKQPAQKKNNSRDTSSNNNNNRRNNNDKGKKGNRRVRIQDDEDDTGKSDDDEDDEEEKFARQVQKGGNGSGALV